jgi:hypothetical protein
MSEAESIARALKGRKSGNGWSCPCPSLTHGGKDKTPSLSVSEGNDGKLLLRCHKGCTFDDVMAALRSRGLIEEKRRSYARSAEEIIANMAARTARPAPRTYSTEETFMKVEAQVEPLQRGRAWDPLEYERSHIYHDASGNPCRLVAVKRKPDGDKQVVQFGRLADGSWDTAAPKGPAVPYRLPALLAAQGMSPVFIPEGEKDVETLEALGHLATTNAGGAASWHKDLNQFFKGLEVLIVPDADKAGEDRIGKLCDHLAGVAASIKIVRLPGLEFRENHGEDITDWIKRHGHTNEEFIELARQAPEWVPTALLIKSSKDFVAGFVPPEYVLVGVIQRRFLYALTGQTGSGKTAVTLRLAASVARGMDFAGCQTKKCRVLYCAAENPDDVRMRWIALAPHMGFDVDDIDVFFTEGTFSISQMIDKLRSEAERLGGKFGLVIIDTGPAFFEGDDENNRSQMGAHARKFRALIEAIPGGPSIIVNGHPIKNATADNLLPAGGGTYLNEIDGNLTCAKRDSLTEMHWQGKFRGPEFSSMSFLIKTVTHPDLKDSDRRLIPSVICEYISDTAAEEIQAAGRRDEDMVLGILAEKPSASFSDIAISMGWTLHSGKPHKTKAVRCVNELKKAKLIKQTRNGAWELTPEGKKADKGANKDAKSDE